MKKEEIKGAISRVQHEAWQAGGGVEEEGGGGGGKCSGCSLADQTIFLMLGLLKLPALRCFWT